MLAVQYWSDLLLTKHVSDHGACVRFWVGIARLAHTYTLLETRDPRRSWTRLVPNKLLSPGLKVL